MAKKMDWVKGLGIIAIIAVALSVFGVIDLSNIKLEGAQSIIGAQSVVQDQTSYPTGVTSKTCDTSTTPNIRLSAKELLSPYATISEGSLDQNVFYSDNTIADSGYNGSGTAFETELPVDSDVYMFVGDDDDAGTDYYYRRIPSISEPNATFNVDCVSIVPISASLSREGSATLVAENQDINTGTGNVINSNSNIADINGNSRAYTFKLLLSQTASQASFGSPHTDKKVNVVVDVNGSDFSGVTLNSQSAGTGITPPTVTRDENATATYNFAVPTLGAQGNETTSANLTVTTTSSFGTSVKDHTTLGYSIIKVSVQDYAWFYNRNTARYEQGVYDPYDSSDIGASDSTLNIYYF